MYLVRYAAVVFVSFLLTNEALSDTYTEEHLSRELRAIEKKPNTPGSEIYVLRIYGMWDGAGSARVVHALEQVLEIKKISPRVRNRTKYLLALAKARIGNMDSAREAIAAAGFVDKWVVAGPFNNEGGGGLDTAYSPESMADIRADEPMPGKGHDVFWREVPAIANHLGFLHMESLYHPVTNSCFYARTVMAADRAERGILRIGTGGATKVYWNGVEVLKDATYRMSDPDRLAAQVDVLKGFNTLLIKVCTEEKGDFGVFARVTDDRFSPLTLHVLSDQMRLLNAPVKGKTWFRHLPQPAEILFTRAVEAPQRGDLQGIAAEYLYLTNAQDLNTTEVRDMAKKACRKTEDVAYCLLWSSASLDRNEEREALEAAHLKAPRSLEAIVSKARWEMDGPEPAKALPLIRQAYAVRPDSLVAKMLEIDLLSRRGFAKSAYLDAAALHDNHPEVPALIDLISFLAEQAGYQEKALTWKSLGLKYNFDTVSRHDEAAMNALASGDVNALDKHIENLRQIAPFNDAVYQFIAKLLEGRASMSLAEAALRERLCLSPRNASALVDLGLFLMRTKRRSQGIETLEHAARIKPQDTWLSEYLKHLGPQTSFEESFVIPEALFLAWRENPNPGNESRFLVDQTIVKVYESGLSSRFSQQVFEINSREDAKEWRTRYIQFLPDSQQVKILAARVHHPDGTIEKVVRRGTIPISEPWYRLYYDVAAEAIEFPMLSLGDVVEIQYRIDDVATRNIFHDYFGDFVFIEGLNPKQYWRYTLIAPATREFRFNAPSYPGLGMNREKEGENIVYGFEATEIPSLHREGDMPGLVEVASHLHVSTYKSWTDLGEWYRGLLRHQMVPDQRIREKVKELIRGKKRDIDKITAIYNWVVTATRYVGLEFGIHGYKPYRAPLVVARGFGDCKDKASLLVTMLREAGITAEFVLIRTNDLGRLPEEPASLAVFNHAIAHVPKYNLYLDGTAEQHGVFELPFGDQGATAVLLKDEGATFVTTPVAPPERNTTEVETSVVLDDAGDAELATSASIKGTAAAPLRKMLEAAATRRKRFEASLAAIYPGAKLKDLEVTSITDLSKPARYSFSASVPAYAVASDDVIEIQVDEGLNLVREYARLPERDYDLILGAPRVLARRVEITFPEGYVLTDALPEPISIENEFGALDIAVENVEDRLLITRRFVFSTHRVSPKAYAAFVEFLRDVDAALATRIVLRREG